jgi:predicted negative regulator of RcsB-dependent stress response
MTEGHWVAAVFILAILVLAAWRTRQEMKWLAEQERKVREIQEKMQRILNERKETK